MADVRALKRETGPTGAHGYLDEEISAGRASGVVVLTVDETDGRIVRSCVFGEVTQGDLARAGAYLLAEVAGTLVREGR